MGAFLFWWGFTSLNTESEEKGRMATGEKQKALLFSSVFLCALCISVLRFFMEIVLKTRRFCAAGFCVLRHAFLQLRINAI